MVINPENNSTIWYHSTPNDRVESILKNGLLINSKPEYQSKPEPWIYVSTVIFTNEKGFTTFEVNLDEIDEDDVGWPFEDNWQLRVFVNIPANKLKIFKRN